MPRVRLDYGLLTENDGDDAQEEKDDTDPIDTTEFHKEVNDDIDNADDEVKRKVFGNTVKRKISQNVKKVVKLFNYLMARPAKEVERDNKKKAEAEKRAELEAKKAELEAKQNELNQQLYELGSD